MKLIDWLKQQGITPTRFAVSLGVYPQTFANWVHGKATPRVEFAMQIVEATNGAVTLEDLIVPRKTARMVAEYRVDGQTQARHVGIGDGTVEVVDTVVALPGNSGGSR